MKTLPPGTNLFVGRAPPNISNLSPYLSVASRNRNYEPTKLINLKKKRKKNEQKQVKALLWKEENNGYHKKGILIRVGHLPKLAFSPYG